MFSSVGAQHQKSVAARAVCTVIEHAHRSLIHAAIQKLDNIDATLWPFALNHSCYVSNEVPKESSFFPSQILSKHYFS